jgi:hypothetical protein
LDRVVEGMLAGLGRYRLEPVVYRRLSSPEAVTFRQDVFRDLGEPALVERLRVFDDRMTSVWQGRGAMGAAQACAAVTNVLAGTSGDGCALTGCLLRGNLREARDVVVHPRGRR